MAKVKLVGKVLGAVLMAVFGLGLSPSNAQDEALVSDESLKSAVSYIKQKEIGSAIEVLEQALAQAETPEEHAKIGVLLGQCYVWASHEPDRAIEVLQKVLEYDPEFEYIFYQYGDQLYEARSLHPPEHWFEELPIAPPALPVPPPPGLPPALWAPPPTAPPASAVYSIGLSARVALGDAYYHLKWDKKAALREWEIALERYPEAHALQGNVYRARQELGLSGADMPLEEARTMVRVADEAYDRGDYTEALRLARKVLEERGDIYVLWPGEGARHPAREADIYDTNEFIRAQMVAAQETGAEMIIKIAGTTPRKIIFHATYKMGDWEATARMAEEILAQNPDADVARSKLKVARAKLAEAKQALAPLVTYSEGRSLYVVGEGVPREGQLWVPLRGIDQLPGACVTWDQATGSATMLVGNHTFTVWPGRQEVLVDGALRPLSAAPYLDKDRLMVPVHFLANALNRQVKWEAESGLLHIVPKIAWVR